MVIAVAVAIAAMGDGADAGADDVAMLVERA